MLDTELLERIIARRAELDELEEQLAKRLAEVRTTFPPDYQRILAAVRQAAGPVMARQVGDALGIDISVRAKLEPPRGKLVRLVDRGWLGKLPDGRFTTRL
ncbi:hypothetical protein OK074_4774 [Actinobacteria bacterium OK074]|nr:hypothetical protein OK074_4774 [Actinobacteria bacterium OK074]